MADNLLETYNPLYDVHLRQYFNLPHMQKHLRNVGLLENAGESQPSGQPDSELYARHHAMMDMLLRNRERVLFQMADLQKKLDAAEKVEIYRRIRSGITSAEEFRRSHMSRSLSRPARSGKSKRSTTGDRQRRYSNCFDDSELMTRIEAEYRPTDVEALRNHSKNIYNRLAASVYKYQYLHKLDDKTLLNYMHSLKKQLQKLERFRELSFGPNSVAKHHPANLQTSWFFRRRSEGNLPNLTNSAPPNTLHQPLRSIKSLRKNRSGKSQSPHKYSPADGYSTNNHSSSKARRPNASAFQSKTRGPVPRLPPLPKKAVRSSTSTVNQTLPKLPPTAMIRPTLKDKRATAGSPKQGVSPPLSKASNAASPDVVPSPPILPDIGAATVVGGGVATIAALSNGGEKQREAESPAMSVGEAPSEESLPFKYEEEAATGDTETRPTPEPFLEEAIKSPSNYEEEVSGSTPEAKEHREHSIEHEKTEELVHSQEQHSPESQTHYYEDEKVEELEEKLEKHTYHRSQKENSPESQQSMEEKTDSPELAANGDYEDQLERGKGSEVDEEEDQIFQKDVEKVYTPEAEMHNSSFLMEEEHQKENRHIEEKNEPIYDHHPFTSPTHSEKEDQYQKECAFSDDDRESTHAFTNQNGKELEHPLQSHTYLEGQEHESHKILHHEKEPEDRLEIDAKSYEQISTAHKENNHEEEKMKGPEEKVESYTYQEFITPELEAYNDTPEKEASTEPENFHFNNSLNHVDLAQPLSPQPFDEHTHADMQEMVEKAGSEKENEYYQRHKRSSALSLENRQQEEMPVIANSQGEEEEIVCEEEQCYIRSPREQEDSHPNHSSPEEQGMQIQPTFPPAHEEEEQSTATPQLQKTPVSEVCIEDSPTASLISEDHETNYNEERHQEISSSQQQFDEVSFVSAVIPDQHPEDLNDNINLDDKKHRVLQSPDEHKEQNKELDHLDANPYETHQKEHQNTEDIEEPTQVIYHQQLSEESAISQDHPTDVEEPLEAIYHKPLTTELSDSEEFSPRSQNEQHSHSHSSPEKQQIEKDNYQQHYSQDSLDTSQDLLDDSHANLSARSADSTYQHENNFESQPTMEVEEENSTIEPNYAGVEHNEEVNLLMGNDLNELKKEVEHIHPDHFFSPSSVQEKEEIIDPGSGSKKNSISIDQEEHLVPEAAATELANHEELFKNEHEYNEPEPEHVDNSVVVMNQDDQQYPTIDKEDVEHFLKEVQPGAHKLLAQPSIEITPASEYGGSLEEHMDRAEISTPASDQAISPTEKEHEITSLEPEGDLYEHNKNPDSTTTNNGNEDHSTFHKKDVNHFIEKEQEDKSCENASLPFHDLDNSANKADDYGSDKEEQEDEGEDSDSVIIHNQKHTEHSLLDGRLKNGEEANGNHF